MEKDTKTKILTFLKGSISYIIIIVAVLLFKQFIIAPIKVNGDSMNETLMNNDIMLLDKISYRFTDIKRFDIVVIKKDKEYIIKRIIGLPGDVVEYKDNKLYINGKEVEEDFKHDRNTNDYKEEKIKDGYYFVVGDNRDISLDSRIIGLIKREEILGKTSLVIFPFNRFGVKK